MGLLVVWLLGLTFALEKKTVISSTLPHDLIEDQ